MMELGGVGGLVRDIYGVQGLLTPYHNCIDFQIPSEGTIRL